MSTRCYEILFTAFQHTPYVKHNLQLITSLTAFAGTSYVKQDFAINLESSTSFTETLLCLFRLGGLNITHTHD